MMIDKSVGAPAVPKLIQWGKEFHEAETWAERAALLSGFRAHFKDELAADPTLSRFYKLGERIVYEGAPEELSAERQAAMKKFIAGRILNPNPSAPYMTIAKARKELASIEWQRQQPGNEKWKDVKDGDIRRLKLFYTAVEKEYTAYAPQYQKKAANDDAAPQQTAKKPSTGFNGRAPKPPQP